ncbi:MAG TPA: alanine--tRNA ligase, partial [Phycisphaerales bacterium]|nr:alanine--tRNA ligase [Phycisphaerales bacterium]
MSLSSDQIRRQFIDFFVERASHTFVPSSPVVPHDDPTLLFTNAGMNQFKPLFLGQVDPGSAMAKLKRAVNSQKCIRAGGKHNDLDDVGKDTYHHTFFEMLGNWSFGDYFKREAIQWAWELLTDIWKIDPDRLYATYFEGNKAQGLEPDREAYELWQKYLPKNRIIPGVMKDNFWEMGDTGPCGPCSEIHFDGRPDAERRATGGDSLVNRSHPNVIEIWNLVFIQFNRTKEGLSPLPAKHVDTGMGFERITRVIQGKDSNYDTDVFAPLFAAIKQITKARDYTGKLDDPVDTAYRVIADHARTLTFAITDGAEPSNEGRGYVLRRILRRAVRYGRQTLGVPGAFVCDLVPTVVESMGGFFPELKKNPQRVIKVIRDEEEAFGRTLTQGLAHFGRAAEGKKQVAAEDAFKLHDTYGFPIDLTQQMAEERGMTVDAAGFERLMEEAREKARGATRNTAEGPGALTTEAVASLKRMRVEPTEDADKFHGRKMRARIEAIWNGHDFDESLIASDTRPTDRFALIVDKTCFYAEMGGQVGDAGRIVLERSSRGTTGIGAGGGEFLVEDTRQTAGYVLHVGRALKGELRVGDEVEMRVDTPRRGAIAANHTSTHLLNHALRAVLGEHVEQKGSLVAPDRLRFDFSHSGPVKEEEARAIEQRVGEAIRANLEVFAEIAPIGQARTINGLRAVFGEAYPDPVRVVSIGAAVKSLLADPGSAAWRNYSVEFCGGTHLTRTGEAEAFALLSEEGVAKGVRRIIGVPGVFRRGKTALARERRGDAFRPAPPGG